MELQERRLEKLAEAINREYEALERDQKSMLARAFAIGDMLIEAKALGKETGEIPHGKFGGWCGRNVRVKKQQYAKYMRLARQIPKVQRSVLLDSGDGVDRVYATLAGPGDEIEATNEDSDRTCDPSPKPAHPAPITGGTSDPTCEKKPPVEGDEQARDVWKVPLELWTIAELEREIHEHERIYRQDERQWVWLCLADHLRYQLEMKRFGKELDPLPAVEEELEGKDAFEQIVFLAWCRFKRREGAPPT